MRKWKTYRESWEHSRWWWYYLHCRSLATRLAVTSLNLEHLKTYNQPNSLFFITNEWNFLSQYRLTISPSDIKPRLFIIMKKILKKILLLKLQQMVNILNLYKTVKTVHSPPECPLSVCTGRHCSWTTTLPDDPNVEEGPAPRLVCQIMTSLSSPPEARNLPLQDHRTQLTHAGCGRYHNRDVSSGSKLGQIGPKQNKCGTF